MSETKRHNRSTNEMSPIIGLGGVLTVKRMLLAYKLLLNGKTNSDVPAHERFIPPPERGLGKREEMYKDVEDRVFRLHEKFNEPATIVGHSLGSYFMFRLALDHPDWFNHGVSLGGLIGGIKQEPPSMKLLTSFLGNPPGKQDLMYNSEHMQEMRHRAITKGLPGMELHLIATPFDDLVKFPTGLQIELPEGQPVERLITAPPFPGLLNYYRRHSGIADLQQLVTPLPVTHYDIQTNLSVIHHINELRRPGEVLAFSPRPTGLPEAALPVPVAA
jgi:pimeloyl-ACP methyl ester carboxylesterase